MRLFISFIVVLYFLAILYKLSPFLCKKIQGNLSAGRVQSVTLRLVVDRDREIENFKPQEYWTLSCEIKSENGKDKIVVFLAANKDKKIKTKEDVLIVGLGNEEVTPDALGPNVIKEVEVTRHIIKYMPEYIDENARPISAIAPGVLGTTGMETLEIIKGIVDNTKPKLIIVIDALASRSIDIKYWNSTRCRSWKYKKRNKYKYTWHSCYCNWNTNSC